MGAFRGLTPNLQHFAIFYSPYVINVVQKPIPVADEGEVVVRVQLSSLCGSDLHQFRGHDPAKPDSPFTMGHEMVGKISECHPSVKDFKVGDLVVAPFTISCGKCFFCVRGFTGRCEKSRLFGCERLEGAQAEYVRVPMAGELIIGERLYTGVPLISLSNPQSRLSSTPLKICQPNIS